MTTDEVLDSIIHTEGGFDDRQDDKGGPTKFGITATTLGDWRRLGRPAWRSEVLALDLPEARDIYRARYAPPFAGVPFDEVKAQLIDYGVLSGPETAVKALQVVLGVAVDGVLGKQTLAALAVHDRRLVNAALVAQRVKLFVGIVARDESQRVFLRGWCARAVGFL